MKNFSFDRIASLLRYDWMLHKRTLTLTFIVIVLLYIVVAFATFVANAELSDIFGNAKMPEQIRMVIDMYGSFASIAVILVMTTLLTEKFCYPRTATSYLTIPGTPLEKFLVVVIDYVIASVVFDAVLIVMAYVTMGIGFLFAPDLDWSVSLLHYVWPYSVDEINQMEFGSRPEVALDAWLRFEKELKSTMSLFLWLWPCVNIIDIGLHAVICMLFKSNVQIKAVVCRLLFCVVLSIVCIIAFCSYLGYAKAHGTLGAENLYELFSKICGAYRYYCYAMPFIAGGLVYLFYRQVRAKQAK